MFELERDLQLDHHVTVLIERDTIRNMRDELCVVECSYSPVLFPYMLFLARSTREFFRLFVIYSIA
jgi:hypothetical protein